MKLSASHYDSTITISCNNDDLTLDQCRDTLIIPMLVALGYDPESVQELFFDKEDYEKEREEIPSTD